MQLDTKMNTEVLKNKIEEIMETLRKVNRKPDIYEASKEIKTLPKPFLKTGT